MDSAFQRLQAAPREHTHVGWSAVLSVAPGARRPTVEALRAQVAARLHRVPRCRQRLQSGPLGLGEPRWADDPHFDLAAHLTALTDPDDAVTPEGFAALRDELLSEPLDRRRPPWHVVLVPRLADGHVGVVGRVHHATADGLAAFQVAMLLLDAGSDGEIPGAGSWVAQRAPGVAWWALEPLLDGVELTGRALRGAARAVRRPRRGARAVVSGAGRVACALHNEVVSRAPESPLNVGLGSRRTLIGCSAPLDELRAARAQVGGTLNDVALTVVAGVLRSLALERDEAPHALKAMVPVSAGRAHEDAEPGRQISMCGVWLPLHLGSAQARLRHVRDQTESLRPTRRFSLARSLASGVGLVPGMPREALLRSEGSSSAFNLTVSNVSGPPRALSMLGARLEEIHPVMPIGQSHALSVGMFSYDDRLHFGLHADPDVLPAVTRLPALLAAEVRALSEARRHEDAPVISLESRRPSALTGAGGF